MALLKVIIIETENGSGNTQGGIIDIFLYTAVGIAADIGCKRFDIAYNGDFLTLFIYCGDIFVEEQIGEGFVRFTLRENGKDVVTSVQARKGFNLLSAPL